MANPVFCTIKRFWPHETGCYISVSYKTDMKVKPPDDTFELKLDHPNYNSIYSWLLVCAVNKIGFNLRYEENKDPKKFWKIVYVHSPIEGG